MARPMIAGCSCGKEFEGQGYHATRLMWWVHAHPVRAMKYGLSRRGSVN